MRIDVFHHRCARIQIGASRRWRELSEQINSSVITEKIAIDARSRELYEKITNLRSKVAGFNEEEFQKILADIESANKEMLIIQKNLGANSESLEQAKNHSDERSKLLSKYAHSVRIYPRA